MTPQKVIQTHEQYMREAVAAAANGIRSNCGGPFGAVVVCAGQVIARACNRVVKDCDPTAHAEVNAIREACRVLGRFHLEDCELYASCEPCPMCLGAIYWARLRVVYYAATRQDAADAGFSDALIYEELAAKPEARSVKFVKHSGVEAVAVMRTWASDPNRREY
ncbi:MAG: nucleoside deaminase [Kiritimatiellae bacterium]|nr:nucleoside deaminase [Kiritimatiellia bacterium]